MTKKMISDAITNIDTEYIEKAADHTVKKKARKPVWAKWAAMAACLCAIVMIAIPIVQHYNYVTDNEPKKELTVAEAIAYEPFGALYPKTVIDGYVLENDRVSLYDETVIKAVYCNSSVGDIMTITIAAKNYFGDVKISTILEDEQGGTRIYIESGDCVVAYYFSTRDIADIKDFENMVTSASAFQE